MKAGRGGRSSCGKNCDNDLDITIVLIVMTDDDGYLMFDV